MACPRLALGTLVLLLSGIGAIAQQPPPRAKTVPDSIRSTWKMVGRDLTALVDAVPEEKWSFKPTQGAFANVRTFAEQVKHVACANEAWAKELRGERPPDRCDAGGPNPAKTKAEILAYLRESFAMMDGGIAGTREDNLTAPVEGPYAGANRLEALSFALWHVSDHYGQLVVYGRWNGIVPPASR